MRLRWLFCGLLLALCGCAVPSSAGTDAQLPFEEFAMQDGALTVFPQGDYVEPYSALKALITAHRLGVDVRVPADAFATWLVHFQQANGPFPRICRSGGNRWLACGPADSDDSLAVMWCVLAAEVLPARRTLDDSCNRALGNLATLWEPKSQTFRAMFGGQAAYFANNVEVMTVLKQLRQQRDAGVRYAAVLAMLPTNTAMDNGLARNFGYEPNRTLEPQRASVPATPYAFYPHGVAPIYPMIYNLRTGGDRWRDWRSWNARYGQAWQAGTVDYFPWGLAAVAAYMAGDSQSAGRWLWHARRWKEEGRWNIIEEGVQLGLANVLQPIPPQ